MGLRPFRLQRESAVRPGLGLLHVVWMWLMYQVWDGGLEAVEVEKIEILEMLPGNL